MKSEVVVLVSVDWLNKMVEVKVSLTSRCSDG
jgi:hypothetical protein